MAPNCAVDGNGPDRRTVSYWVLVLIGVCVAGVCVALATPAAAQDPAQPIPSDPAVTSGAGVPGAATPDVPGSATPDVPGSVSTTSLAVVPPPAGATAGDQPMTESDKANRVLDVVVGALLALAAIVVAVSVVFWRRTSPARLVAAEAVDVGRGTVGVNRGLDTIAGPSPGPVTIPAEPTCSPAGSSDASEGQFDGDSLIVASILEPAKVDDGWPPAGWDASPEPEHIDGLTEVAASEPPGSEEPWEADMPQMSPGFFGPVVGSPGTDALDAPEDPRAQ